MKQINFSVTGTPTDTPVLNIDGHPDSYRADLSEAGRAIFRLTDTEPTGNGASVFYNGTQMRVLVPPSGAWEADDPSVRPPETASGAMVLRYGARVKRLHAADDALVDDDGNRTVLGLSTDFRLFQMLLAGELIDPILDQRVAAGAQGVRAFGTCDFLFRLDPRQHSTYYADLTFFAEHLADRGLYLQFTAMADMQLGDLRSLDQQDHWLRCCDALADEPNVFLELANEAEKNGVDCRQFTKPARAPLVASGSFCDGWEPTGIWGDLVCFHPRRDWKWFFTVPATVNELRAYPGYRKPFWIGEPIGAADQNDPGRRANDPALFEKLGAGIGIYASGGCFHSEAGLSSALWSDQQMACATAFYRGLHR